jgi:hypothetical protein
MMAPTMIAVMIPLIITIFPFRPDPRDDLAG